MKISFREISQNKGKETEALVLLVNKSGAATAAGKKVSAGLGQAVARALKSPRFSGKNGQTLSLIAPEKSSHGRIILLGIGEEPLTTPYAWQKLGGTLSAHLNAQGIADASVLLDVAGPKTLKAGEAAAEFALGARLRHYSFDKYRTKMKPEEKLSLANLTLMTGDHKAASTTFAELDKLADGIFFTRDLVSEPANILYPESFAKECQKLTKLGVKVEVLGVKEMTKLGMGSLLGVGQGSAKESKVVIMQWHGNPKDKGKPLAFLGKGVCFDTGGISIKPANGMEEMKWDMGGAGVVTGLMHTLAARKAKANVIGVIGLVENMPDGNAQRPGDIVTSMSGQTIEVQNTDAEGRLVLADILWYTQDRFKPRFMVDLATLTGAIIIALGNKKAGLFSNDDTLSQQIHAIGDAIGEEVWRLPLGDYYDKLIDCPVADMKNISAGREAGSTTAAQFLQRFVNGVPWVHLDIAGTAWAYKDTETCPKGASGFGVQLLNNLVKQHYEQ